MVLHTQGTSERQTPPKLLSCFVGLEGRYGLQLCRCQDAQMLFSTSLCVYELGNC